MSDTDIFILGAFSLMYFGSRGVSENMPSVFENSVRALTRNMNRKIIITYFIGAMLSFYNFSGLRACLTTLGFANSGLLKLPQVASFLLGSFLGIGLATWILLLHIGTAKFILILIGLLFVVIGLETRWQHIGKMFFFLGCTLLGVELFTSSLNFKNSDIVFYLNQIQFIGKPGFLLLGFVLTLIFRSGFTVFGVIISLLIAKKITYIYALFMITGVYLGEALPLFLFTRGAHRITKFAVAIMLFSATLGVAILLSVLYIFNIGLGENVNPDLSSVISFYNIGCLIIGLVGLLNLPVYIKLLNIWFPKKDETENHKIQIFSSPSLLSSIVLIENAVLETEKLFIMVKNVINVSKDFLKSKNTADFDRVIKLTAIIDRIQNEILIFLQKSNEFSLNEDQSRLISKIQLLNYEFNKIAIVSKSILEKVQFIRTDEMGQTLKNGAQILDQITLFSTDKSAVELLKTKEVNFEALMRQNSEPLANIFGDHVIAICDIVTKTEFYKQFDFTSLLESKKRAMGL